MRPALQPYQRRTASEVSRALVGARQHVDRDARLGGDLGENLVTVGRIAHRGSGERHDLLTSR